MTMDKDALLREQFEKWITAPPFEKDVSRYGETGTYWPGCYEDYQVHLAWDAWKESARAVALAEPESAPTATQEPVAEADILATDAFGTPWIRPIKGAKIQKGERLYPESALQAERERAEKAIKHYLHELETSQIECERAEKAEAERDKLRAEHAALKEALRNCRRELWHCNEQLKHNGYNEGGDVTKALAESAHLLKD